MPVPFGFSVGDIVTILNLFKEVGVALKEHGGASKDYQKTLQHLTAVHAVLVQLEHFKSSTGSLSEINAIRGQAQSIQHDVKEFLKKIEKYKSALGATARTKFYRGVFPKIKWSQYVAQEVESLETRLEIQLSNIHNLLGLHHNNVTSRIYDGQLKLQDDVQKTSARNTRLLENCELGAIRTQLSVQQAASSTQRQIVTSSENLIDRMNVLEKSLKNEIVSRSSDQATYITQQLADAQARLDMRVDQFEYYTNIVVDAQQHTATTGDLLELKDMLALHLRDKQRTQASNRDANETTPIMLTLTLPRLNITKRDLKILLRHLCAEVEIVFRLLFASFFVCWKDLLLALPQIIVIYKILQRLPQAISLTLHDNMIFEDALGRVQSLQYQQFKHWTVFEAGLRCTFANMPGMKKVYDGHFVLTTPAPVRTLTASNWTQLVKPGLEIRMFIIIKTITTAAGQCPRGCGTVGNIMSNGETCCSQCGLYFRSERDHRGAKPPPRPEPVNDCVEMPGTEQSSNGGAQRASITATTATQGKTNTSQYPQDDHPTNAPGFNALTADANGAGPIDYDKWFQDQHLESEEIKVMKRVLLDYISIGMMRAWPSEPWTTLKSMFSKPRLFDEILPDKVNDQTVSFSYERCFAHTSGLSPFEGLSSSKTEPANQLPSHDFLPPYQKPHHRDQGQNDREAADTNLGADWGNSSASRHCAASPATSTTSMNSTVSKVGRPSGSHLPEKDRISAAEMRDRGACFRCWYMKEKCTPGQSPCANCLRLTRSKGFRYWMTPCSFKRLEERCDYMLPGEFDALSVAGPQLRNEAPLVNQIGVSQMRAFLSQYQSANSRKFILHLSIGFGQPWTFWAVELMPGIHQFHQMFAFRRQLAVEHPSALPYLLTCPPVVPLWVDPLLMQVNIDCWLDKMIGDSQTGWQHRWYPDSCQIWQLKILEGICRQYRLHEAPNDNDRVGKLAYETLRYALKMSVLNYVMCHAFLVPEEHVDMLFQHLENPHFKQAHPENVSPPAANKFIKMMALPVMRLVTKKTLSGLHELLRECVPPWRIWDQTFAAVFLCLMVISSTQRALFQRAIIYAANNDSSYGRPDAAFDARTMDEELVVYMVGMFHDKFRTISTNKGFNPLSGIGNVGHQPYWSFAAYVKTMTDEYYQLPPNNDISNIGAERLLARFMRPFFSRM